MGKGKGSFDHWASRIAVSKIIFEVKGDIHEQVVRDAFRLAGNKMPGKNISRDDCRTVYVVSGFSFTNLYILGMYEFVKKGDAPVVGITKLDGITMEQLKRPRRAMALNALLKIPSTDSMSESAPSSTSPEA